MADKSLVLIEAGRVTLYSTRTEDGVELLDKPQVQDAQVNLVFDDKSYRQYIVSGNTFERLKVVAATGEKWTNVVKALVDEVLDSHMIQEDTPGYNPPERYPDGLLPLQQRRRSYEYVKFSFDGEHEARTFDLDVALANEARLSLAGRPGKSEEFKIAGF